MSGSSMLIGGVFLMVCVFVSAYYIWSRIGRRQRELEARLRIAAEPEFVTSSMARSKVRKMEKKLKSDAEQKLKKELGIDPELDISIDRKTD